VLGELVDMLPVDALPLLHSLWTGQPSRHAYMRVVPTQSPDPVQIAQLILVAIGVVVVTIGWRMKQEGVQRE
jgi:hypothetical protein